MGGTARQGDFPEPTAPLTGAVGRGDAAAFAAFYEAWFGRVYAAARALTKRDEAFCLDVVQEAMLRVARKMRAMETERDVERWMNRVVHTTALDLLRREARRTRRERAHGSAPAGNAGSEDAAELTERIAWLRARISELPREDAALLGLRVMRGRTLESAGAAVGVSGDAAHGRVRRAVARLRAIAKEAFGESA